jgi:uncharacterized membrane protein (DUF106 family)
MGALAQITIWITGLLDYLLGWLLILPRDAAILIVAVGTSLLLVAVRKWMTNQNQLRRCRDDVRRLKELIRQAKRTGDKAAAARTRATLATVNGMRLRAEGKPLLAAVVPIVLLAVWAVERLDYIPPKVGEDLVVRAYYPLSSVDELTHMVPPKSVEMRGSAVRLVEADPDGGGNGLASWVLRPGAPSDSVELVIRHQRETAKHTLRVGRRIYAPPLAAHDGGKILATEVVLRRARFLGIVPGIPAVGCPPWLLAYLLIAASLVPIWRRLFRVY